MSRRRERSLIQRSPARTRPSSDSVTRPATTYDRDTSAYPRLLVSDEGSDSVSEPRGEQAGVERTTRPRTTDGGYWISHRNRFVVTRCSMECYGIGEMPAPNHKGWRTSGGSHGDDTDSDGASLAGPQPYTGEETRVPPVCCRFPLSAGWNLEGDDNPEIRWSDSSAFTRRRRSRATVVGA